MNITKLTLALSLGIIFVAVDARFDARQEALSKSDLASVAAALPADGGAEPPDPHGHLRIGEPNQDGGGMVRHLADALFHSMPHNSSHGLRLLKKPDPTVITGGVPGANKVEVCHWAEGQGGKYILISTSLKGWENGHMKHEKDCLCEESDCYCEPLSGLLGEDECTGICSGNHCSEEDFGECNAVVCDPWTGSCVVDKTYPLDSNPCTDDGNECTTNICSSGSCVVDETYPLDYNPCTDEEKECTYCLSGTCVVDPYNILDGDDCDDGDSDTTNDQCSNGVCIGEKSVPLGLYAFLYGKLYLLDHENDNEKSVVLEDIGFYTSVNHGATSLDANNFYVSEPYGIWFMHLGPSSARSVQICPGTDFNQARGLAYDGEFIFANMKGPSNHRSKNSQTVFYSTIYKIRPSDCSKTPIKPYPDPSGTNEIQLRGLTICSSNPNLLYALEARRVTDTQRLLVYDTLSDVWQMKGKVRFPWPGVPHETGNAEPGEISCDCSSGKIYTNTGSAHVYSFDPSSVNLSSILDADFIASSKLGGYGSLAFNTCTVGQCQSEKNTPGICGCDETDTDSDGDGLPDCVDKCPYVADKVDQGCSGDCNIPDVPKLCYRDDDWDGFGAGDASEECYCRNSVCECPSGMSESNEDCFEWQDWSTGLPDPETINPGAIEICGDGLDNNCDGQVDEGC